MRRGLTVLAILILGGALGACGDDDDEGAAPEAEDTTTTSAEPDDENAVPTIAVTARDYFFEMPESFQGGLVTLTMANEGKESHFGALAKAAEGATFEDVMKALSTPPSATPPPGPPPFVEYAAVATTDPGVSTNATFNLPSGTYAMFCAIPAADGTPHLLRGMIRPVTVTEGKAGTLPDSVGVVTATDFALDDVPSLDAGPTVVGVRNQGKQLHEINLVELAEGRTVEDAAAWYRQPAGPPPMRNLGGVAVSPGEDGTSEFDLKSGASYAFVCGIPDRLGDFAAHITKGMYTPAFTVD